jgi:hypothetical protein
MKNTRKETETRLNEWHLGEEILAVTHRWNIIIIFILVGALMGWATSYLWPSPYRATRDIYVGLNAYRFENDIYAASLAEEPFRMVDDYKNWQMEQLNDLITSDVFLRETLDKLSEEDSYWDRISTEDLRKMNSAMWRNVGEWHLVVEAPESERAVQAILAWENTIIERITEALEHARAVVSLDVEMNQLAENKQVLELRLLELDFIGQEMIFRMDELRSQLDEFNISSNDYSAILAMVSQIAVWEPGWDRLLDKAPPHGSTTVEILSWMEEVLSLIDQERVLLPLQIALIDEKFSSVNLQYQEEAEKSFGLAGTLVVDREEMTAAAVDRIRPKGTLILVGGILGLFAWLIWGLVAFQNRMHTR